MVCPVPACGFSRTYVITGDTGLAVVDVGSVGAADDVMEFIKRSLGGDVKDVRAILATHFHFDHIGGIGRLLFSAAADTKVFFHRLVKDYLEGRNVLAPMKNWCTAFGPTAWKSAGYVRKPSHLHFESLAGIPLPALRKLSTLPYPMDRIVFFDGDGARRYLAGFDGWEVIETPGHTEDSLSFYHGGSEELICGDLMVNMDKGGKGRLNGFYASKEGVVESFDFLLRNVKAKTIYPGHGEPVQSEGNALRGVEAFAVGRDDALKDIG
ncbi:MAG TPA: MBL fold metallo-hydrolase [Syntrophales bacterium]|nr:MBL fold metallo-hydrolase [Syntrophales bacterium]HRT71420.1 MBL fold metallo-hydrolase [Syntrophales bacterium]